MSVEACSLQLLQCCKLGQQQWTQLLQPLDNQLPSNEQQFQEMLVKLRRLGRIFEQPRGNVAQLLSNRGHHREGHYRAPADDDHDDPSDSGENAALPAFMIGQCGNQQSGDHLQRTHLVHGRDLEAELLKDPGLYQPTALTTHLQRSGAHDDDPDALASCKLIATPSLCLSYRCKAILLLLLLVMAADS